MTDSARLGGVGFTRLFLPAAAMMFLASQAAAEPPSVLQITVDALSADRVDTPVWAELEGGIDFPAPLRLEEVVGDRREAVPAQLEGSKPPRLWWILAGKTPAGARRTYRLVAGEPAKAQAVQARKDDSSLEVICAGAKVLRYHQAPVEPPRGADKVFTRGGYIHPLWSPAGGVLTEDSPADHLHHKGIWLAWTHTKFEGRVVDFWNLKEHQGTVRFVEFASVTSGPVFGGFQARLDHVVFPPSSKEKTGGKEKAAPKAKPGAEEKPAGQNPAGQTSAPGEKVALREVWDVRVYNVGGPQKGYWLWDIISAQRCASESPLQQLQYHYGGLGFRGAKEWAGPAACYLTSEGLSREKAHGTRARWCDMSGAINDRWAGVVMMSHPANFRHPEPMRVWPEPQGKVFFCFSPSLLGDWTMEAAKDYVFRYRFYVHDGKLDPREADRFWNDFSQPPRVEVKR